MWDSRGSEESPLNGKNEFLSINDQCGGGVCASLLPRVWARASWQRSHCISKLWFSPKKWLLNLTYFYHFLLTIGMYFTYSHLYSERRDVLRVFPIKKKKLWAAFCCDVRKNRLRIPLQKHHRKRATGIHERPPPRTSQQPVGLTHYICKADSEPPVSPKLWRSYKLSLYCMKPNTFL